MSAYFFLKYCIMNGLFVQVFFKYSCASVMSGSGTNGSFEQVKLNHLK